MVDKQTNDHERDYRVYIGLTKAMKECLIFLSCQAERGTKLQRSGVLQTTADGLTGLGCVVLSQNTDIIAGENILTDVC